MTEIAIQIERALKANGLPITPYRYRTTYNGEELGVWEAPACPAARVLVQKGVSRDAVMVIYRGSAPSMRGKVGWFADRQIEDTPGGTLGYRKYRPFQKWNGQ